MSAAGHQPERCAGEAPQDLASAPGPWGADARRLRWAASTLPLAPLAAVLLLVSEWLFAVTKPSATSALSWRAQLEVLAMAPLPYLPALLGVQAFASLASAVAYPRWRGLAALPAACIGGVLAALLADNFTYTVFGFGSLTTGPTLRTIYAAAVPVLMALVGWRIFGWSRSLAERRLAPGAGLAVAGLCLAVPWLAARTPPSEPDSRVLPSNPAVRTGTPGSQAARPNILFMGADGLDAQLLSVYGYQRRTSPFLETIRDETLFFENAFSNATRTHGSLVTLLTGRLPFSTKVTFPPTVLQGADGRRNLAQILKDLGYTTLQLGLRHYADAEDANLFGFDAANYRWQNLQEFTPGDSAANETDVFRTAVAERLDARLAHLYFLEPVADAFAHVEGDLVVPQWRDARRVETLSGYFSQAPEPWFVHLHMIDTHCCNFAPDERRFTGGPSNAVDARDSTFLEADMHMQQLFEALRTSGRLERTVVVISSDHASMWKAHERVPLMIRFPRAEVKGRVIANVQLADVAPTMLDYLGVQVPAWMDGISLLAPERWTEERNIFGVADVGRREGTPGLRLLLDSGAPNYGVSSAMLIAGHRWYLMNMGDGSVKSGDVAGHTRPVQRPMADEEAGRLIRTRIEAAGFEVGRSRARTAPSTTSPPAIDNPRHAP
ncbi:MAG: sulfatase-like hydrolase/transferase [Acidobacteria bacterium]|nr:sulfatase-like hydrolase/transferase [Acidobacteriota bacterium]